MKYRCYLCEPAVAGDSGFEFDVPADVKPECPKCGSGLASGALHQLAIVHFEAPKNEALRGRKGIGHIACDPAKRPGVNGRQATGNPSVVNCEACLKTDVWHAEATATGLVHERQHAFFYKTPPAPPASAAEEPEPEELRTAPKIDAEEPTEIPGLN